LITNKALQSIVTILSAESWKLAIGTGTTPAWVDNETLQSEVAREDATVTKGTTYIVDDTLIFEASFVLASAESISEVGVFCVGATPFMLERMQFSPIDIPASRAFPVKMAVPIRRP
jgi:hypothetical protein